MTLSKEARNEEIKRRKSGGNLSIPDSREGETVLGFLKLKGSLYLYSEYSLYSVQTSDDIDPGVTQSNVPWIVTKSLDVGYEDLLCGKSIRLFREFSKVVWNTKNTQKDISSHLYGFLVTISELSHGRKLFQSSLNLLLDDKVKLVSESGTGLQVKNIENFEISFSIYLSASKRLLIKLIAFSEWALSITKSEGPKLDAFIKKALKKSKNDKLTESLSHLKQFEELGKLINILRNAFEHPSEKHKVVLSNNTMQPNGQILAPMWTLMRADEKDLKHDYLSWIETTEEYFAFLIESIFALVAVAKNESTFEWQFAYDENKELITNIILPDHVLQQINKFEKQSTES